MRQSDGRRCGTVSALWRYPVKSFRGESLGSSSVDERGLVGDRAFAVRDANGKLGSGKTTRRFRLMRGLFDFAAETHDGDVRVRTPDGTTFRAGDPRLDALLSSRYREPVALCPEGMVSHFDAGPVHILTSSSLRWVGAEYGRDDAADARRYRPNVVIDTVEDGLVEEAWLGALLLIGSCVLHVTSKVERCVMPTFRQDNLPRAPELLRFLVARNEMNLGVYADVVSPGTLSLGDSAVLEDRAGFGHA